MKTSIISYDGTNIIYSKFNTRIDYHIITLSKFNQANCYENVTINNICQLNSKKNDKLHTQLCTVVSQFPSLTNGGKTSA